MMMEYDMGEEIVEVNETLDEMVGEQESVFREMEEFVRAALEQDGGELQLTYGEYNVWGRFTPGRVEAIDAEAAEFDPELQELSKALDTWFVQGEQMSCAVAVQTMAVNQLENGSYTEQQFIDVGREHNWYNNGTAADDVGKIAEYKGMDVERLHGMPTSELAQANNPEVKVLANVDSTLLQFPGAFKRCQPDHCVQVLRVEKTEAGEMVIINDPGHEGGRGAVYPMEVFEKAYKGDMTTIRKAAMA